MSREISARNKGRRGIAIEYAIVMMFVVLSFCTMLIILCMESTVQNKNAGDTYAEYNAIHQIGEDFLSDPRSFTSGRRGDYDVSCYSDPTHCYMFVQKNKKTTVLKVTVQATGAENAWDSWKVTEWQYYVTTVNDKEES